MMSLLELAERIDVDAVPLWHESMNQDPRTLVLHIGWPKTGTTSLQKFFAVNRDVLFKEAGIFYPRTGIVEFAHHGLAQSLSIEAAESSPLWAELTAELEQENDCRQVLISCEGLQAAESGRAGRFLAMLPGFDRVVLMAYVRQPDEIRESNFGQAIRDGRWSGSFAGYLEMVETQGKFDYLGRINNWRVILPKAELVVRPFERAQWHGDDLLQDFCHSLGWAELTGLEGIQVTDHSNPSLGWDLLVLARDMNRLVMDQRDPTQHHGFTAVLHALERRGLLDTVETGGTDLLAPRNRRELRQREQPCLEQLGIRFDAGLPQGEEAGVRDLPEFAELSAGRQVELHRLALKGAVLGLDDLQAVYWDHQRLKQKLADLKAKEKDARRQLKALQAGHKALERRHGKLERQFAKTLRCRWLRLKAWWRARRGRSLENNAG